MSDFVWDRAAWDHYCKIKHADYKAWWALRGSEIPHLGSRWVCVCLPHQGEPYCDLQGAAYAVHTRFPHGNIKTVTVRFPFAIFPHGKL